MVCVWRAPHALDSMPCSRACEFSPLCGQFVASALLPHSVPAMHACSRTTRCGMCALSRNALGRCRTCGRWHIQPLERRTSLLRKTNPLYHPFWGGRRGEQRGQWTRGIAKHALSLYHTLCIKRGASVSPPCRTRESGPVLAPSDRIPRSPQGVMATRDNRACQLTVAGEDVSVAYTNWTPAPDATTTAGASADIPVFCVHGLSRNRCDFDALGAYFAGRGRRVIAVDVVGRGDSTWLKDKTQYTAPTYAAMCEELLKALGVACVDWVGTSMGGIIGMTLLAKIGKGGTLIRRFVLNDIGFFIPSDASNRIGVYVGKDPSFQTVEEVEAYYRVVMGGMVMSDAQWRAFAEASQCRREGDPPGTLRLRYDPAIGDPFRKHIDDIDLSTLWQAVAVPTLLLRGARSDVLLQATAEAMAALPHCELVVVDGVGHAPPLVEEAELAVLQRFFASS